MRIVKFSDTNVIVHDGYRKWNISIDVGNYEYSHVDYSEGVIRIREDSPNVYLELLHEVHHLYTPLLEPIWTPLIPNESLIARYFNNPDNIIEDVLKVVRPKFDMEIFHGLLKIFPMLGTFDNILEDMRIHDHVLKEHGIDLSPVEQDVMKMRYAVVLISRKIFGRLTNLPFPFQISSFRFYTILDHLLCKAQGWRLSDYYDLCERTLRDALRNNGFKSIFKIAFEHRIKLELQRIRRLRLGFIYSP